MNHKTKKPSEPADKMTQSFTENTKSDDSKKTENKPNLRHETFASLMCFVSFFILPASVMIKIFIDFGVAFNGDDTWDIATAIKYWVVSLTCLWLICTYLIHYGSCFHYLPNYIKSFFSKKV